MDRFRTRNSFYGGQVGTRLRWDSSWMYLAGHATVAAGVTEQTVDVMGSTTLARADGTSATLNGGVLALPSNIGTRSRSVFSYSPEAGVNVGLKLTQHVAVQAGYTFTYWSRVVRPGRQIDPGVNPSQVPTDNSFGAGVLGPTRPVFAFNDEDIYFHTLSRGLNVNY